MGASLQHTTCIYVGAASRLPLVSASFRTPRVCFIQELVQQGIISAKQCPTAVQIPDIGIIALPRIPSKSFSHQLLSDGHVDSK